METFDKPVSKLKLKSFIFWISPGLFPVRFGGEDASKDRGPIVYFGGGVHGCEGLAGKAGLSVPVCKRLQHQQ